jgi:glycosyltransferase involved in cell wall biosynthesis
MTPRVSTIMATYNYGQYLAGSISSALAQSYADQEIVIVDDGSTDNTPQIVAQYAQEPRIRYFRTEHVGQPAAKNFGIQQARGELLAFLDADDLWEPEKLALQVPLFDASPRVGVVYTRFEMIDAQGTLLKYDQPELYRGDVLAQMFRQNFVGFSTCVVRRSVFEDVGRFDEQIPMAIDYELWLRVARHWQFDYVDKPLLRYRTGHANLSQRGEERLRIALEIMDRFVASLGADERVDRAAIRRAYSETFCTLGLVRRDRSRAAAATALCQAIAWHPASLKPWRELAAALLPESARRGVRRLMGRPVDWRTRPAAHTSRTNGQSDSLASA